jgi:hypothetical protein
VSSNLNFETNEISYKSYASDGLHIVCIFNYVLSIIANGGYAKFSGGRDTTAFLKLA